MDTRWMAITLPALTLLLSVSVALAADALPQQSAGDRGTQEYRVVAFVDVNVVPMDSERVLADQTVLVEDGRITVIAPASEVRVPAGALRIDGRGKYLMPGLTDMHVHTWQENLFVFLANGVTTIRIMNGSPVVLGWRERVEQGELEGPTIYAVGRIFDAPSGGSGDVTYKTAEDVRRLVAEDVAAGYDFIKVYNRLPGYAYDAVVAATAQNDIPVVGHVPFETGIAGVLAARQASIEHLTGYIFQLVRPDSPVKPDEDYRSRKQAWNYVDESKFAEVAEATRDAGPWNCPTFVALWQETLPSDEYIEHRLVPEARYLSYRSRQMLPADRTGFFEGWTEADFALAHSGLEMQKLFVKALNDAGAKLLVGTDSWFRGFSVHQELEFFVAAGLTPYETLKAGTWNAAEFLGALDEFGSVAEGRRADLILVEGNPLEDVRNAARRAGEMVRGRWYSEEELRDRLEALALLLEGWDLARDGNIAEALAKYAEVQASYPARAITALEWNRLCWFGSIWESPADVMAACDRAVTADPELGYVRGSRALARALTGNVAGAIMDLEAFVAWTSTERAVRLLNPARVESARTEWQGWLDALRAGENPFTSEFLEQRRER